MKRLLLLLLVLTIPLVGYAQTSTVTWTNVHQTMDGFGGQTYGSANNLTSGQADMFFSPTAGIGLEYVRTANVCPNTSTCSAVVGPDLVTLQEAIARGAKVELSLQSPPANMKVSGTFQDGTGGIITADYAAYATYIVNLINALAANGVPISVLSVQNEPNFSPSSLGACIWTAAQFDTFVGTYLGPALASAGLSSVQVMLGETTGWLGVSADLTSLCLGDSTCAQYVSIAAGHGYGTDGPPDGFPAQASGSYCCSTAAAYGPGAGKKLWMSEINGGFTYLSGPGLWAWDPSMADAIVWARNIHDYMTIAGTSGWLYWELADCCAGPYNDGYTDGSFNPSKRMYVIGQYSKFVRSGWVRIDATANPVSGVYVSAYKDPVSGNFVVVATNTNGSNTALNVALSGVTATSVTPWVTSASLNLAAQSPITTTSGGTAFSSTLAATSVTTFSGTMGGGGGGGGAATLVNHSAGGANASSFTLSIPATTSGNLLVASCATIGSTIAITDSASQTYSAASSVINDPAGVNAQVLDVQHTTAGVTSVTCNSNGGKVDVYADKYSGTTLSSVVDQVVSAVGASSTLMDSGFATVTTNPNDVLYGFGTNYNSGTFTAGNDGQGDNYNLVDGVPQHVGSAVENFISTTSAKSYKATMTGSGPSTSIMIMVAFAFVGSGGTAPIATLSPTSVNFGNQTVGTTSAGQPITLTNTGSASLALTSITATGNFAQTNNCPVGAGSLAPSAFCTITVTFTPSTTGVRSGSISVVDNASGSPHTVALNGTGVSSGGGSIRLVNHSAGGANASIFTLTIPSTTAGNFMVAGCVTIGSTISITDSGSQVYQPASSLVNDPAGVKAQVWFFPNTAAGITSVTCSSNGGKVDVYANEYSGLGTTGGVDQVVFAVGASSTTADSGFSATTTNAVDLLYGLGTNYNSNTFTAGNDGRGDNYALLDSVPSHVGSADENFISTTSTNSYKATMSGNAASTSIMIMVAFSPSGGGGGGGPIVPVIDFSVNNGAASYRASGFWNGINSTAPSPALVNPTKPRLMRGTSIYTTDSGTLPRVQSFSPGTVPMFLLGDLWATTGGRSYPINPCSGGCSAWTTFVTNTVNTYGTSFVYDVLNEPDNAAVFSGTESDYDAAWSAAYTAIKAINGAIVIVGPSTSSWDMWATDFMAYATTNSMLPSELSFHETSTVPTATSDIAAAKAYLAANNPSITKIDITQFDGLSTTYLPGTAVQYLSTLERTQVNDVARMCWNGDCLDNSLDGLIGTNGTTVRAVWYAYQGYGNITGNIIGVTASTNGSTTVDGVAGQDSTLKQAYSVFGISGASTNVTFNFTNISSSAGYLIVGGLVHGKLYTVANDNGTGSTGPVLVSEADYTVSGNTISIALPSMTADSVAIVQLTPPAPAVSCGTGLVCYYIDYVGGSDSNNGTSKITPWKHVPGMIGTVAGVGPGIIATGTGAGTGFVPGQNFILKGGVTWPSTVFPLVMVFTGSSSSTSSVGCAGAGCIYVGVDKTWFTGSSWTRPIFDGQETTPAVDWGGVQTAVDLFGGYFVLDNIEYPNWWQVGNTANTWSIIAIRATHSETKNNYIHAWGHSGSTGGVGGNFLDQGRLISGGPACPPDMTSSIHDNVVDGIDSSQDAFGAIDAGQGYVYNNYIAWTVTEMLSSARYAFNNTFGPTAPTFFELSVHGNVLEMTNCTLIAFNNFSTTGRGGATFFTSPITGAVDAYFNNVFVNQTNQTFQIDNDGIAQTGGGAGSGAYVFNNTIQSPAGFSGIPINAGTGGTGHGGTDVMPFVYVANNHLIADNPTVNLGMYIGTPTNTHNIGMTNAVATTDGYVASSTFPYTPPTGSAITVGAGLSGTTMAAICASLPSDALANPQAACLKDATLGVNYNTTTHTVTLPERNPLLHPAGSATWSSSAYEFVGTPPPPPTPSPHVITGSMQPLDILHGPYASMWYQGE